MTCVFHGQVLHLANPVEVLVPQAWGPESPTGGGAVLQEHLSSSGVCILAPFLQAGVPQVSPDPTFSSQS